jgi:hypothetical protein
MDSRKRFFRLVGGILVLMTVGFGGTAYAGKPTISTVPVVNLPNGGPVAGASSKIIRTDKGITVSVETTVNPGAYTMWLLIFNNPGECHGNPVAPGLRCVPGPPGVSGFDIPSCVLYGAGHVVGNNGKLNYTAHQQAWVPGSGPDCGNGLMYPRTADVHAAVRSHGEKVPGMVSEQINTFGGGCVTNECYEVQGAAHEEPLP